MEPKRTLVIGDIHGNLEALLNSLDKVNFNIREDRIICIGDYIDGWDNSFEVVRTLLEIKNTSSFNNIFLLGNHDKWFLNILTNDFSNWRNENYIKRKYTNWYIQGGQSTLNSYLKYDDEFIQIHKSSFFEKLSYYHLENNKLYIHAGFDTKLGFNQTVETNKEELIWNRSLYQEAYNNHLSNQLLINAGKEPIIHKYGAFEKIYIGHTATTINGIDQPIQMGNLINIDQGCKKRGILTIWIDESNTFCQNT